MKEKYLKVSHQTKQLQPSKALQSHCNHFGEQWNNMLQKPTSPMPVSERPDLQCPLMPATLVFLLGTDTTLEYVHFSVPCSFSLHIPPSY